MINIGDYILINKDVYSTGYAFPIGSIFKVLNIEPHHTSNSYIIYSIKHVYSADLDSVYIDPRYCTNEYYLINKKNDGHIIKLNKNIVESLFEDET